jgi:hypothetical protein
MTIRRFESVVGTSDWSFASLECVPIRKLRWLAGRHTREFVTSFVRCRLLPRGSLQTSYSSSERSSSA